MICLGLLGFLGAALAINLSQSWAATLLVVGHLGLLLHTPVNGLILLFCLPPFFTGESARPYFFLLEIFVYSTLLAWGLLRWPRLRPIRIPGAPGILFFLVATVIALPLDLRELWLELRTASFQETWRTLWGGSVHPSLNYVRSVLNVASGIGLFIAAANEDWGEPLLVRLLEGIALVYAAVGIAGALLYAGYLGGTGTYLSLSLVGRYGGGFTALAYNQSYYAQYAVPCLPLVAGAILLSRTKRLWCVGGGAVIAGVAGIVLTNQRGAYVCLLLAAGVLLAAPLWLEGRGKRVFLPSLVILLVTSLTAAVVVLTTAAGPSILQRAVNLYDWVRVHLWRVTFNMLREYPLLGVGTGRFTRFFAEYSSIGPREFGPWGTSHGLYSQILAEQGLLGFTAFLSLLGFLYVRPLVASLRGRGRGAVRLLLLSSIGIWLVYGLFQYTFYIRGMQLFLWIGLGIVASAAPWLALMPRLSGRVLVLVLLLVIPLGGWRANEALSRPLPPDFSRGTYRWERQPDGKLAQWAQGRAFVNLRVEGEVLRLELAALFPGVETRRQVVRIYLDGTLEKVVELVNPRWIAVEIPVSKPVGLYTLLGIETRYTVVPRRMGLGSDSRRLGVMVRPVEWPPQ